MSVSKSLTTGLVFVLIGGVFAVWSIASLPMGTPSEMGPGFFPTLVGATLVLFGVAVPLADREPGRLFADQVNWRGLGCILAGTVVFGLAVRPVGFVPATALLVFIVSRASRRMSWRMSALLSIGITAFCTAIFIYAVGLSFPLLAY